MGVRVAVGDGELAGAALLRLRKQLEWAGVLWEVRRRSYFVDETALRRAKAYRKRFKARQAALKARMAAGLSGSALDEAKAKFWRRTGKK